MAMYGYVRCSTDRQVVLAQMDQLRAAGCKQIFRDEAIRATDKNRPGLLSVRRKLKPGDVFTVTAIDRAFRSTLEALLFLDDVQKDDITFRILIENIDTRTPEGRHWFTVKAADAEYERAKISRRTREYMGAAKLRGKRFGRPRKLTNKRILWARRELRGKRKKTMRQVARRLRVHPRTLSRALSEFG